MRITLIALSLFSLLLVGCSNLRPLSSKPPVSAIILKSPAKFTGFLYTATFPAGEYRPLYEDDGGFYYQAPAKIIQRDILSTLLDGGLYVDRSTNEPTQWYIINPQNGIPTLNRCWSLPEHTLVP